MLLVKSLHLESLIHYILNFASLPVVLIYFVVSCDVTDEQNMMLFGSACLGFVHLTSLGLEFTQCVNRNDILLPVLQFFFVFVMMHFVFMEAKRKGSQIGFSNIAIGHLLATQVTLWLLHFDRNYTSCGYSLAFSKSVNSSKVLTTEEMIAESLMPSLSLTHFLRPIVHHYQLLTIVVMVSFWLMNNASREAEGQSGKSSFFADDNFVYNFLKRKASVKGFFLGLLMTTAAIIVIFLQDLHLSLISHTALQVRNEEEDGIHKKCESQDPLTHFSYFWRCLRHFFGLSFYSFRLKIQIPLSAMKG